MWNELDILRNHMDVKIRSRDSYISFDAYFDDIFKIFRNFGHGFSSKESEDVTEVILLCS